MHTISPPASLALSVPLCGTSLPILATLQPLPTLGRCIELFENRLKRRKITWENGYVVRPHRPIASKSTSIDSSAGPPTGLDDLLETTFCTNLTALLWIAWIIGRKRLEELRRNSYRVTTGDNAARTARMLPRRENQFLVALAKHRELSPDFDEATQNPKLSKLNVNAFSKRSPETPLFVVR